MIVIQLIPYLTLISFTMDLVSDLSILDSLFHLIEIII